MLFAKNDPSELWGGVARGHKYPQLSFLTALRAPAGSCGFLRASAGIKKVTHFCLNLHQK